MGVPGAWCQTMESIVLSEWRYLDHSFIPSSRLLNNFQKTQWNETKAIQNSYNNLAIAVVSITSHTFSWMVIFRPSLINSLSTVFMRSRFGSFPLSPSNLTFTLPRFAEGISRLMAAWIDPDLLGNTPADISEVNLWRHGTSWIQCNLHVISHLMNRN